MIPLLIVIVIAVVVVLSIQNATPVVITFFLWKFEASLAIVIFISFICGLVIAGMAFSVSSLRNFFKRRSRVGQKKEDDHV